MTEEFNKWWNSDGLVEGNPYRKDSPAYWAWEGWQAAHEQTICANCAKEIYNCARCGEWQGLTDEEIKEILDCGRPNLVNIKKAEQKLKEKNT